MPTVAPEHRAMPIEPGVAPVWVDIDRALDELHARKDSWVQVSVEDRITILAELRRGVAEIEERWVAASLEAKGLAPGGYGEGEERAYFAILTRALRLLQQALRDIRDPGRPRIPGGLTVRPNGQVVARVLPASLYDRVVFPGMTGEVWIEPGLSIDDVVQQQAAIYHAPMQSGRVALVLNSSNFGFLPVTDVLYKLFVANEVVALKLHPMLAYLGPLFEEALRALIGRGFLRVIYGDADIAGYLCSHPLVGTIHLTGSDTTFDTIMFGAGAEGAWRKAHHVPLIDKPVTAELGNITPVVIVPGQWSDADLQRQATLLASAFIQNASYLCATPRLIVQHRGWRQRDAFMAAFEQVLARIPTRRAYVPDARRKLDALLNTHPRARRIGRPGADQLPWTVIPDLDPAVLGEQCFGRESLCPAIGETTLDAPDVASFIARAVEFLNQRVWGTLVATIVVHPRTLRDHHVRAAFDQAVSDLCYGTLTINSLAQHAVLAGLMPWGAFPGADVADIQSGTGKMSNPLMLPHPQKSILRGPFRPLAGPFLVDAHHVVETSRALVQLEQAPSLWRLLRLMWPALRG